MAVALSRGSAHHTGLNHVHGAADGCRDETSHEGRSEMSAQVIRHAEPVDAETLKGVV